MRAAIRRATDRRTGGQVRFASKEEGAEKADKADKGSLGSNFGGAAEHKDSMLLKSFVAIGQGIEAVTKAVSESSLGSIVAPKQQQVHQWGEVKVEEVIVEKNEDGETVVKSKHDDKRVEGVDINTEQFAVVPVGEVEDHAKPDETAWGMFKTLLTQKKFKTSQQQATEVLYEHISDFSEAEFLEDIETQLMPGFLEAFWKKDKETLQRMCSDACYHLNVDTHLKQYEHMDSHCKLLMTRRAALFNRLMFVDDSDHAPSVKRRQQLAEQGVDFDEDDDLDVDGVCHESPGCCLCDK